MPAEKHACDKCHKTFGSPRSLQGHKARKHSAKRSYIRRKAATEVSLSFCPCCGTNLRTIAMALAAVKGI
jgi:hypothetical protein